MVFPIVGGTQSTGYEISNSLRFNDGDSPSLAITPGSAGDRKTFTYSGWVKRSSVEEDNGQDHLFMVNGGNADDTWFQLRFEDNDLVVSSYNARMVRTDRKFRDPSAWYHIVVAVDTTQGTASNRVKLYVNGVQETTFSTTSYPSQDSNTGVNGTYRHFIGAEGGTSGNGSGNFYDGYMTEVHLIDGSALTPTSFGEFNDNGIWIPKQYTGSYGTNGFFLEFKQTGTSQNSSGIGADTSGNDNHFAVTNLAALDVTEDTCTNNFATLNAVDTASNITLTEGNTTGTANTNHSASRATIGFTTGKWYWENKVINVSGGPAIGVMSSDAPLANQVNSTQSRWYRNQGQKFNNSTETTGYGATFAANDIIGVALNLDDGEITFYKNGSSQGVAFTDLISSTSESWHPAIKVYDEGISVNFGNPSFSISSGNTDGKYGNFEYAPPSGYYALCTKRLAEFG